MPRTGCPTGSSTQGLHRWKKNKRLCVSWGEKLKQQNHRFDGISKNDKHVQLKACFEREPQKWKTSGRSWSGTWSLPLHMRWTSSWRSCWWWCCSCLIFVLFLNKQIFRPENFTLKCAEIHDKPSQKQDSRRSFGFLYTQTNIRCW